MTKPIYYTSLFANCGIGTFLTKDIGFECAVANEYDLARSVLHQDLHKECQMVYGDFTNPEIFEKVVRLHSERGCSGVIITCPCQTFSVCGGQHLDDPAVWLFLYALEFIRRTEPEFLIFENVPYFISDKQPPIITDRLGGKTIKEHIVEFLQSLNYTGTVGKLDSSRYGTPQARRRAIILASKKGRWDFPKADDKRLTVREAIGHFKSLEPGARDPENPFHYAPYIPECQAEVLRRTPTGKSAMSNPDPWKPVNVDGRPSMAQHKGVFGRMSWDKPAPTIIMGSDSICGDWTIHPGNDLGNGIFDNPRPLSPAELFRLTGLPDSFCAAIPAWARPNDKLLRQVIGEALMPRLVQRLLSTLPR